MVWNEDVPVKAEQYAALNMTEREMAALIGVARQTFSEWKTEHPELADAIERGRAKLVQGLSHVVVAEGVTNKNADVALKTLAKVSRERWGDVSRTEITGADGGAVKVDLTGLSFEQLLALKRSDDPTAKSPDVSS